MLAVLALMVVTARVLVVVSGSFMSHIDLTKINEGYTVPNVESQVFTTNIPNIYALIGY